MHDFFRRFIWEKDSLSTLRVVIQKINDAGTGGLVVTSRGKLFGVITDGDVRRALLHGASLESPALEYVNTQPYTSSLASYLREPMPRSAHGHKVIPIIDNANKVIGATGSQILREVARETLVLVMAGGRGERLRPLTQETPKPLVEIIEGRTILGEILSKLESEGFEEVVLSTRYKAEKITKFIEASNYATLNLRELRETEPLGTAGALRLVNSNKFQVLVTNGDVLTDSNYSTLALARVLSNSRAVVYTRQFSLQVPFGVVKSSNSKVVEIEEKPSQQFDVLAGIYCLSLSDELTNTLSGERSIDMPELLRSLAIHGSQGVHAVKIVGKWLDLGTIKDLELARTYFEFG